LRTFNPPPTPPPVNVEERTKPDKGRTREGYLSCPHAFKKRFLTFRAIREKGELENV